MDKWLKAGILRN